LQVAGRNPPFSQSPIPAHPEIAVQVPPESTGSLGAPAARRNFPRSR
jgi:hypothetical protein